MYDLLIDDELIATGNFKEMLKLLPEGTEHIETSGFLKNGTKLEFHIFYTPDGEEAVIETSHIKNRKGKKYYDN